MVPLDKLDQITRRFEFLEAKLAAGAPPAEIAPLSREYSELKPVVAEIATYRRALADLDEAQAMLTDPEMRALAEDEMPRLKARIPEMEQALRLALLPKDAADARPAILEIRPGTGGEEAALFAAVGTAGQRCTSLRRPSLPRPRAPRSGWACSGSRCSRRWRASCSTSRRATRTTGPSRRARRRA